MAKAKKQEAVELKPADLKHSVLMAAWARFEAGDMVEARRLANAVLAGQVGSDDLQAATTLSALMSGTDGMVIDTTVNSVAQAIVARTQVVPKSYVFAGVAAAVFLTLVVLAATRYAS